MNLLTKYKWLYGFGWAIKVFMLAWGFAWIGQLCGPG